MRGRLLGIGCLAFWLYEDHLAAWVVVLDPLPLQKLGVGVLLFILGVPSVGCGDSVVVLCDVGITSSSSLCGYRWMRGFCLGLEGIVVWR